MLTHESLALLSDLALGLQVGDTSMLGGLSEILQAAPLLSLVMGSGARDSLIKTRQPSWNLLEEYLHRGTRWVWGSSRLTHPSLKA